MIEWRALGGDFDAHLPAEVTPGDRVRIFQDVAWGALGNYPPAMYTRPRPEVEPVSTTIARAAAQETSPLPAGRCWKWTP